MTEPLFRDLGVTEARLWRLIEERTRPGSDQASIDRRIWDLFGEDWAVLYTDLAGFSRNVAQFGIIHFLQVIWEQKRLFLPILDQHDGVLVKVEADSMLVLFRRPTSALACAVALREATHRHNATRLPEEHVLLCCGIGYGQVLRLGDTDVYGREVNAASKLGEDTARTDEILVTDEMRVALGDRADLAFEKLPVKVPGASACYRVTVAAASTLMPARPGEGT